MEQGRQKKGQPFRETRAIDESLDIRCAEVHGPVISVSNKQSIDNKSTCYCALVSRISNANACRWST